jgi:hypothetical protein
VFARRACGHGNTRRLHGLPLRAPSVRSRRHAVARRTHLAMGLALRRRCHVHRTLPRCAIWAPEQCSKVNSTLARPLNATLPDQAAGVAAIDAEMLWTMAGMLAFVWFFSNFVCALLCKREYLQTFWSTETAAQYTKRTKWDGANDAKRASVLTKLHSSYLLAVPGRGATVASGQLGRVGGAAAEVVQRAVEAGAAELGSHAGVACSARWEGATALERRRAAGRCWGPAHCDSEPAAVTANTEHAPARPARPLVPSVVPRLQPTSKPG